MNTVNYVRLLFSLMSSVMIIVSSLMNSFERYLPVFIRQSFRYGKFAYSGKPTLANKLEVPKSWFRHFYLYSSVLTSFILGLTIKVYMFDSVPPIWLEDLLDEAGGFYREARVSSTHVLLALSLMTLQCVRRLYDTNFVSVFGINSKMNLPHYFIGFIHYTGVVLAILMEAPVFSPTVGRPKVRIFDLKLIDYLATALFLWAWYHQYVATVILGNLRRNNRGEVVTQNHQLPRGDWFEYLSSPHSTAEILMYFSLTVILWENITWLFIFAWVLCNQVETILMSHWWYQETFKEFPTKRRALIPFVY